MVRQARAPRPIARIGIYTPYYPGITGDSGIGTYTKHLATALVERGHEMHVLVPGAFPDVSDGGVHVHSASTRHLRIVDRIVPGAGACFRVGRAMHRLVEDFDLDVVEFANWEGFAPWFALRRQVPMVVRFHTSSLETIEIDALRMTWSRRADVWREIATAKMADMLVTHSRAHQLTMARELNIAPEKIRIVPHGISSAPLSEIEREPNTIVYVGRLERRKGTVDLLNAAAIVVRKNPGAKFVLIGLDRPHCPGGIMHAQYLAEHFPADVRDRVTLLGRLADEEVKNWVQRATIFVAPSLYESFGLVFLEAMRFGTPVIGTHAGGIPEVVEDGKSGVLVPPGDPGKLATAIIEILGSPSRGRSLGEAGRLRCQMEFSVERMAQRMDELYAETIESWRR